MMLIQGITQFLNNVDFQELGCPQDKNMSGFSIDKCRESDSESLCFNCWNFALSKSYKIEEVEE